ncbi:hypothetical protein BX616_000729 [Lobosporangium transversale]|nr:hypothetical protein BX616_000729 [Lobosporangium transversale]
MDRDYHNSSGYENSGHRFSANNIRQNYAHHNSRQDRDDNASQSNRRNGGPGGGGMDRGSSFSRGSNQNYSSSSRSEYPNSRDGYLTHSSGGGDNRGPGRYSSDTKQYQSNNNNYDSKGRDSTNYSSSEPRPKNPTDSLKAYQQAKSSDPFAVGVESSATYFHETYDKLDRKTGLADHYSGTKHSVTIIKTFCEMATQTTEDDVLPHESTWNGIQIVRVTRKHPTDKASPGYTQPPTEHTSSLLKAVSGTGSSIANAGGSSKQHQHSQDHYPPQQRMTRSDDPTRGSNAPGYGTGARYLDKTSAPSRSQNIPQEDEQPQWYGSTSTTRGLSSQPNDGFGTANNTGTASQNQSSAMPAIDQWSITPGATSQKPSAAAPAIDQWSITPGATSQKPSAAAPAIDQWSVAPGTKGWDATPGQKSVGSMVDWSSGKVEGFPEEAKPKAMPLIGAQGIQQQRSSQHQHQFSQRDTFKTDRPVPRGQELHQSLAESQQQGFKYDDVDEKDGGGRRAFTENSWMGEGGGSGNVAGEYRSDDGYPRASDTRGKAPARDSHQLDTQAQSGYGGISDQRSSTFASPPAQERRAMTSEERFNNSNSRRDSVQSNFSSVGSGATAVSGGMSSASGATAVSGSAPSTSRASGADRDGAIAQRRRNEGRGDQGQQSHQHNFRAGPDPNSPAQPSARRFVSTNPGHESAISAWSAASMGATKLSSNPTGANGNSYPTGTMSPSITSAADESGGSSSQSPTNRASHSSGNSATPGILATVNDFQSFMEKAKAFTPSAPTRQKGNQRGRTDSDYDGSRHEDDNSEGTGGYSRGSSVNRGPEWERGVQSSTNTQQQEGSGYQTPQSHDRSIPEEEARIEDDTGADTNVDTNEVAQESKVKPNWSLQADQNDESEAEFERRREMGWQSITSNDGNNGETPPLSGELGSQRDNESSSLSPLAPASPSTTIADDQSRVAIVRTSSISSRGSDSSEVLSAMAMEDNLRSFQNQARSTSPVVTRGTTPTPAVDFGVTVSSNATEEHGEEDSRSQAVEDEDSQSQMTEDREKNPQSQMMKDGEKDAQSQVVQDGEENPQSQVVERKDEPKKESAVENADV